ncbi:NUDIX domain-containing protein [Microbacterium bovistercoris]|uniref:NUDIX domain-containing protein n=1 Tax=Microbacterium bovistercoris TaxID=2293570 RepID=A0A371NTJ8_9MICO|nr:GrpB family protein [Microbacterium bovistercoris]REJ05520.1 NUDIX domain-containing protein [Microbacterium bovistercoris]
MTGERVVLVLSRFDEWAERYGTLRERIAATLGAVPIEHIGSTSVPELPAKDVIDVLIGVPSGRISATVALLVADGFDLEGERDGHAWLSLPNREARTAVVHVVIDGSRQWRDRVDFRDLLRRSSDARARYLAVKERAAVQATGWGDYTASKAEIVAELPKLKDGDMPIDRSYIRVKAMLIAPSPDGRRHLVSRNAPSLEDPQGYDRFVGGSVELGETHREAIIREVDEELGAQIRDLAFLGVVENIFRLDGDLGHEIVALYRGRLDPEPPAEGGTLTEIDGSIVPVVWRPFDDADLDVPLYPVAANEWLRGLEVR